MLSDSRKKVISNVFRDITKLIVAMVIIGQFVPGQTIEMTRLFGGLMVAVLTLGIAIYFGSSKKEEGEN